MSWVVDNAGFYGLRLLLGSVLGGYANMVCNVLARIVSSFFNFNMNRLLVFGTSQRYGRAILRYYCLAVPTMLVSTLLLTQLVKLFGAESASGAALVKIAGDACLYVVNYFLQKHWVFKKSESQKGTSE